MIILNRDGTLTTDSAPERAAKSVKETIEVPGHLVAQQPDLIDRIFTFAFDVVGATGRSMSVSDPRAWTDLPERYVTLRVTKL